MAYEKINFKDYPNKTTPVNADNLNHMEEGIFKNAEENSARKKEIEELMDSLPEEIRTYANKATAAPTTVLDELIGAGIWYEYNKVCTGVPPELEGKTIIALIKNETMLNLTIQTLSVTSNGVIHTWVRRYSSTSSWGSWYKTINSKDMESLRTMYASPSKIPINTDVASLLDMINAMCENSTVTFWIGNYSNIRNEVIAGLSKYGITSIYGTVTIDKINYNSGTTAHVTVKQYSSTKIYVATYSTTNSAGWSEWERLTTNTETEEYFAKCEKKISAKKFVFVSDSYGTGYNPEVDNITSWVHYAAGQFNANYVNLSQGGAGFVAEPTYASIVNAVEVDNTVTDVIVAGGYNDGDTAFDSILTGVKNLYDACKTKYPNAQVSFAYIAASEDPAYSYTLFTGMSRMEKACQYHKIRWLSGTNRWYKLGFNDLFSSDGFHPSSTGHLWIGRAVAKAYRNGYTPLLTETCQVATSLDSTVASISGTDTFFAFVNGDVTTLTTQGNLTVVLKEASSVFANGENAFSLGSLMAFNKRLGINAGIANQPVNACVRDGGVFKECKGTLSVAGGEWKFKPFAILEDGSNFATFSSVDRIIIQSFCLIFPTDLI